MQGFFRFPHYTWGYIVVKNHECKSHHVPSLYVRVYRIYNSILTHKTRSLTIREGISYKTAAQIIKDGFPHYTWGYIDLNPRKLFLLPVPSLYVRVYRKRDEWPKGGHPFPHYTWGYIVLSAIRFWLPAVPSLYVRVYRKISLSAQKSRCSLTIREGISRWFIWFLISWPFPHYTWGYIGRKVAMCWRSHVPSLYVRVYRQELFSRLYAYCSLTIREGISPILMADYILRMFPHYTWGYIARR